MLGPVDQLYPLKGGERKLLEFDNVLFLDPGLGGTGFAFFPYLDEEEHQPPTDTGVIRGKGDTWEARCCDVADKLVDHYQAEEDRSTVSWIVMEFPEQWQGNVKSLASANSGALSKLTFLCGVIAGAFIVEPDCSDVSPGQIVLMAPMRWKGQLPKNVVIDRIGEAWPAYASPRDHEADAIGMGLAAQGGL